VSSALLDTLGTAAFVVASLGLFVFWIKSNEETRTVPRARMDLVCLATWFVLVVGVAGYRLNEALAGRIWHLAAFYLLYGVGYGAITVGEALKRIETLRTGKDPAPRSPSRDASGASLVR
jgi:hypothetical protein